MERFLQTAADRLGEDPLSEHKWRRRLGADGAVVVIAEEDAGITGYAQAAWHRSDGGDSAGHWGIEVIFAEAVPPPGAVARIVEAVTRELSGGAVRLWLSRPELVPSVAAEPWPEVRSLMLMRRLSGAPLPRTGAPPGVEAGIFDPSRDADEWLRVNNAAFAGHPENGALTRSDLEERMAGSWFDREGFLVARTERAVVGFCWTKVHPDGHGEIYIIGVDPAWEGRSIGRWLLVAGLRHLEEERGVPSVFLYVEGDSERAIGLYESAGFAVEKTLRQHEVRPG